MEPLSIIAAATGIARLLGLDEKLGRALGGEKGADVARRVLDATDLVAGVRSPEDLSKAMVANAQFEYDLRAKLLDLAAEEDARVYYDRANARAMQIAALAQADTVSKRFIYYFATAWSLFVMTYLGTITFADIPEPNQRFADTILGFLLGTIVATIINYFFGSSRGSKEKDGSMAAMIDSFKKGGR